MSKTDTIAFVTADEPNPSHYHVDPQCPNFPDSAREVMDTNGLLACSACVLDKSPAERMRDDRRGGSDA